MSHPCVVTIDSRSAPRVLFSGDRLVEVDLPTGSRVVYPKPPLKPLKDVDAAIRYAINHPYNSEPLYAKLRPGMKVTIAMDDISLPLPPMKRPDIRERVLTIVLDLLADYGVDDVEIIVATSVHRRMKDWELRHVVGDKIFNAFWPKRLYNHDAENLANMKYLGTTEEGEEVELNRRAVESDLIIYVNLNLVPMDGGHKSVAVGLCGYRSLRAHHNPRVMRQCHSYMDPKSSALNTSVVRMGRLANKKLNVFTIETTINNRMFDTPLEFLAKNEDDLSRTERNALQALRFTLDKMPQPARQAIFQRVPSPFGVTGVFAGETEAVHEHTLRKSFEQYCVPVVGQSDILITGIPFISPYNVNSFLNPLLVQVMANGYLFNLYRNAPMVKKGGTMIIMHPCTDLFDNEHHSPYIEFVHRVLPETRDAMELHKVWEPKFAKNPAYIEMYRYGHAYHPTHPFFMWYWGEAGRQHLGRVIVVGADNEYIPQLLGWETARTMDEALRMAKQTAPPNPDILALHCPPIFMADMSVEKQRAPIAALPESQG
ncbi:lactate racemase domain-containing protein [Polyangium mundeleinium]|uniref:Lactate racemase domain-containing protein n=1 Tax=Polyangium mundeleinium TaxID=2995306 RepID=A0ABT5F646_9BACT|nr:lactate racemase domain-containing protein [Polyangium mundeleinium]MDC0749578.1 lactate racemase domain-containing protein [Polyangium mundeleinium]